MTRAGLNKLKLPDEPGIYIFKKGPKILYIGKATSLRDRVRSYFSADIGKARGERIVAMVAGATSVAHQTADSILEALILEANLIKKHQPPYNVDEKDNKSFNYVVVTKENFPRVLVVRGRDLFSLTTKNYQLKTIFGPFPHGMQLQEAMKIIRRIFPFRDAKCIPCGEGKNSKCRPCFNRQIGLCPGVCTGEMKKGEYAQRVKHICRFLSGNFKGLKRELAREMKIAAKAEKFEEAAQLRRQIHALEHVRDVSLIKDEHRVAPGGGVRIEAFDVAHTGGSETVAVMTVVQSGEAMKQAYRMFKIRTATNDDVASLKEALSRRFNHPEWPLPRIFVVDGGKGQMRTAQSVLKQAGVEIPIVGVVKNQFHKPERLIGDKRAIEVHERDILLANNEAHRFALQWHRKRRGRIY
ncbi:MAG: UvrB/UvrC motif-containing protein [Patescibacteria group bacterium]